MYIAYQQKPVHLNQNSSRTKPNDQSWESSSDVRKWRLGLKLAKHFKCVVGVVFPFRLGALSNSWKALGRLK